MAACGEVPFPTLGASTTPPMPTIFFQENYDAWSRLIPKLRDFSIGAVVYYAMEARASVTNRPAIICISLLHLVGIDSMYGLILRNGYIDDLISLRNHGPYVLPGSNVPILTTFCGIQPLDKLLTLAGVMFANVTDGSAPQLSLYAFQFAGQLIPIWTVMMIEGIRQGNIGGPLSFSALWGCAMQALGFGFVMPIYAIVHLLCSPIAGNVGTSLAASVRPRDLIFIETLAPSIAIGYILPTILMAVPVPWSTLHQWLGGLWQGFPLWTLVLQYMLGRRKRQAFTQGQDKPQSSDRSARSDPGYKRTEQYILHRAYLFAFNMAATTQLATFAILIARKAFPSLFSRTLLESLSFKQVFKPPMFKSPAKTRNMAIGVHNFFQYDQYVGSVAALLWALTLYRNSLREPMTMRSWIWLGAEVTGLSFLVGPGGALVSLLWKRDSRVIEDKDLYPK